MFVWSMKTTKKELALLLVGLLLFISAMVYVLFPRGDKETAALTEQGYSLNASDANERSLFIKQFGWQTDDEPEEVREIVIPTSFSDVYTEYNENVQKPQGFDLSRYCGESIKRWTYRVTNYPQCDDVVFINILIKDGKVIGGDVCSTALDGFMHGFSPELDPEKVAQAMKKTYSDEAEKDRTVPEKIPEEENVKGNED